MPLKKETETKLSVVGGIRHKVKFLAEYNLFEFRIFFLLEWLAKKKTKEPNLSYYSLISGG